MMCMYTCILFTWLYVWISAPCFSLFSFFQPYPVRINIRFAPSDRIITVQESLPTPQTHKPHRHMATNLELGTASEHGELVLFWKLPLLSHLSDWWQLFLVKWKNVSQFVFSPGNQQNHQCPDTQKYTTVQFVSAGGWCCSSAAPSNSASTLTGAEIPDFQHFQSSLFLFAFSDIVSFREQRGYAVMLWSDCLSAVYIRRSDSPQTVNKDVT